MINVPSSLPYSLSHNQGHFGRPNPRGFPGLFPGSQHRVEFGPGLKFPSIWKPAKQGRSARPPYFPRGGSTPPLESGILFPEREAKRRRQRRCLGIASTAPLPPRRRTASTSDVHALQVSLLGFLLSSDLRPPLGFLLLLTPFFVDLGEAVVKQQHSEARLVVYVRPHTASDSSQQQIRLALTLPSVSLPRCLILIP